MNDTIRWRNYIRDSIVEPAIGRDLLQLSPVENPSLLRQVFGAAISTPAQLLSTQKMQGKLQERGTVPTISKYLKLLSQAFLVTSLEKYSPSQLRAKKSIPKLIIHDNALCRAFERPIVEPISPERFGRYFENSIGARFIESGWDTFYWRHRNLEVDLVVIGPQNQKWAIEVKSSEAKFSDLIGVREFCKKYTDFQPCIISFIDQEFDGILTLDTKEILSLKTQ